MLHNCADRGQAVCIRGKESSAWILPYRRAPRNLGFWCYLLLKHTLARKEITLEKANILRIFDI